MRLSKHKLPKGVNKQVRTVKHKDSEKKRLRKEAKATKLSEMQVEVPSGTTESLGRLSYIHVK
jgi:hypothetical protein